MFLEKNRNFHRWRPAAWLRVTGSEALIFLQGQLTNDLRKLMAGQAVYGLWLNQKGKVVADSFVLPAGADAWWVASYFSPAAVIRERLEGYIIADDVMIEDVTADWAAVTVWGTPDEAAGFTARVSGSVSFPGRRSRDAHWEWIFPVSATAQVEAALAGGQEYSAEELLRRRVEAGIPAVPADIGLGELPNEGGLEADAISYTKGCYLGQEVMARLKSMGQVRRRLLRVTGGGAMPVVPAAVYHGDRKVGEVRSAVATPTGWAGLALLSLMNLSVTTGLSLVPGGPAELTLAESP